MAQSSTLEILRAATKPLRAADVVKIASQGRATPVSTGLIGRDLKKLAEKGEAKQNADKTWEATKEAKVGGSTAPETPKQPGIPVDVAAELTKAKVATEAIKANTGATKEVRLRVNVTRGSEKGHADSGIDGPYTTEDGHEANTGKPCPKCHAILEERRAAAEKAAASKAELDAFDAKVYDVFEKVDHKSPFGVAQGLYKMGVIHDVREIENVNQAFKRLEKAGKIKRLLTA